METIQFFKKNIKKIQLLYLGDLLFLFCFFLLQNFTVPKIVESMNKLFEILQNAYQSSDPNNLLDLDPAILQTELFKSQYNVILTYTIISLLSVLILFLLIEGLVWFFAQEKKYKIDHAKFWLIPSIYYFISILIVFVLTPRVYQNVNLSIGLLIVALFLFIYSTSFFYASHYLKKSFLEHLLLPFKTTILVQPFLLFAGIMLILSYILVQLIFINGYLGLLFLVLIILPFVQFSRIHAILIVDNRHF
ncbi:hypothetical protein COV11_00225 [Candidatus Woesearchaeota archaeon CG10_big_fil_rev_8_21_14_0_10_30_7]|nr:MAG: hypothetical protein COV11_00225 [Candidatus Woesearchaeota archaeon CG10_big_fil_rev_8_21_14_0_10_30_7]